MTLPRIGLLIPSSNTVMERDFHRELDPMAEVHTARMFMVDTTRTGEQFMLDDEADPAARRVATVEPDVVVFGCTSASSLHGADYDDRFRARLCAITSSPVVGVLSSAIAELTGVGRVALFTPYVDELTGTIAESLRTGGINIVAQRGLGIDHNFTIGRLSPEQIVTEVLAMDLSQADAIFCSCTNLRAFEARESLAAAAGLPVYSSNQVVTAQVKAQLSLASVASGAC